MIYRRKEDEIIHINIVGIGHFGKETVEIFRKGNLECFGANESESIKMIVNSNEVSSVCNIVYENKVYSNDDNLIPWNENEIEAEKKTKSILILIGNGLDVSFKMFQMTAVSLFGSSEHMRVAFLQGDDTTLSNRLITQQIDHVFECKNSRETAEMIRMFLKSIYFNRYDLCTSERIKLRYLFGKCDNIKMSYESVTCFARKETEYDISELVEKTTESLIRKINPFRKYIAYISVEGHLTLASLNRVIDAFRKKTEQIQILDEKLSMSSLLDEHAYNCMVLLYEVSEA